MKKGKKPNYLIWIILFAIVISLIITILITWKLVTKKADKQEIFPTEMENALLENAYILSSDDESIHYLYQNEAYTMNGKMDSDYVGVADIEIQNGDIQKVYAKSDAVKGVIESYTKEQIEIQDYGFLPKEEEIPVYFCKDDQVTQGALQNLIVGTSKVKYVMANNVIEAILVDENTIAENIRVVIKNESEISYSSLFVTATESFQISGENLLEEIPAGRIVDVVQYMRDHQLQRMKLLSKEGGISLCDSEGNALGLPYPDTLFCLYENEQIVLVNEIPIEEYVKRVLPSEMPAKFEIEALKAQAVCARTYAYSQMKNGTYAMYGANIDNTTAFQVYNTVAATDKTNQAVEETNGQIVSFNGQLITCYYYSTNPGTTEDMEVWKSDEDVVEPATEVPYLHKTYETDENPGSLETDPAITAFIEKAPNAYDNISPFYRWTANMNLGKLSDAEFGKVKSIQVNKRSSSGYVLELEIQCEKGKRVLSDENDIRTYLGKGLENVTLSNGTIRTDLTLIPSACFYIKTITANNCELSGGGFGHGIGMSQYGAASMAEQGKTYDQIITFYYKDVIITDMKNISY